MIDAIDEYKALKPKNRQTVSRLLARRGLEFDEILRNSIEGRRLDIPDRPLLSVLCANALIWTHHAIDEAEFMENATRYFVSGDENSMEEACGFSHRFGSDSLEMSLRAMYEYYQMIDRQMLPDDVDKLADSQVQLMEAVAAGKDSGRFRGLGPWLFPSPFKLFLTWNKSLWDAPNVNRVMLSLGTQVQRALKWLERDDILQRAPYLDDDTDGSEINGAKFLEKMATVLIRHQQICDLASEANSIAQHINSGLYELGYQGA